VSHDFAYVYGGAERVTSAIALDVLPEAGVRIVSGNRATVERMGLTGRTRFVMPPSLLRERIYRQTAPLYAPLVPLARVDGNLLASSYAFAHHLRVSGRKVVYCHSPLRQAWANDDVLAAASSRMRPVLRATSAYLRALDRRSSRDVETYVATSREVQRRIREAYGVEAPIIPPPVDLDEFHPPGGSGVERDHYLWVGRIVEPYKRLAVLVETFRRRPERLLVAGDGRDRARIAAAAPSNVTFLGVVGRDELVHLYGSARALLFPSTDDFGIVPLEAMACGTSVIAHRSGGALDTVVEGETGVFFDHATPAAIDDALNRHATIAWQEHRLAEHASRYSRPTFAARLRALLGI
jgi:glycosyltransferase involved in cell wall biosynthesis